MPTPRSDDPPPRPTRGAAKGGAKGAATRPSASPANAARRTKTTVLVVRLSPEDRALVAEAAAAHELDVSAWVRQTVVLAAKRWKTRSAGADADPDGPAG